MAEVKNVWSCTSTLQICLHGMKHRENFTSTLFLNKPLGFFIYIWVPKEEKK
jgi:hypothetical protein